LLLNNAKKATIWETSKECASFDIAWAERSGLAALALFVVNGEVVDVIGTSCVDVEAVKAQLGVL
jgi:hypothetical protein